MAQELNAKEQIANMELKLKQIEQKIDKRDEEKVALLTIAKGLLDLVKQALDIV